MPKARLQRCAAFGVHLFTGFGSVCGLLALLSASDGAWERCFGWLGIALIIDGADGPLARKLAVEKVLPRFSGKVLDQIVDYLNYVTVPAYVLARSEILPREVRLPSAAAVMLVSLYHFSDTGSKSGEGYFVGFPTLWNIAVLYCFVLAVPPGPALLFLLLCALLTFIPFYWLHPVRVKRLRPLTLGVASLWAAAAVAAVLHGFPGSPWQQLIFAGAALYFAIVGLSGGMKGKPQNAHQGS